LRGLISEMKGFEQGDFLELVEELG